MVTTGLAPGVADASGLDDGFVACRVTGVILAAPRVGATVGADEAVAAVALEAATFWAMACDRPLKATVRLKAPAKRVEVFMVCLS